MRRTAGLVILSLAVSLAMCLTGLLHPGSAQAGLFAGKAKGMASVDIEGVSLENVQKAVKKVFRADGFRTQESTETLFIFRKAGSRRDDLKYGAPGGGGVWIRAEVVIHQEEEDFFWVECNVFYEQNRGLTLIKDETPVLKMFGKKYQRLLRSVKSQAKKFSKTTKDVEE